MKRLRCVLAASCVLFGGCEDARKIEFRDLVASYVQRDGAGDFLRSDPWLDTALVGVRDPFDEAVLVSTGIIVSFTVSDSMGVATVEYDWVAVMAADEHGRLLIAEVDSTETFRFTGVQRNGRWLLSTWPDAPRVFVGTVADRPSLTVAERERLLRLVPAR